MAFADYLDLRTAVIETVGDPDIANVSDRLTLLAESKLNRRLRTRFQVADAPFVVTDSGSSLPVDFLEFIGLSQGKRDIDWHPGCHLNPGSYTMRYYAKLPTLTTRLAESNWLLEVYPDVYLYAVAVEAARHLKDVDLATALSAGLNEALLSVDADDGSARYAQARVRVCGVTP